MNTKTDWYIDGYDMRNPQDRVLYVEDGRKLQGEYEARIRLAVADRAAAAVAKLAKEGGK